MESDRLHLRPRSIQDLDLCLAMDRDPKVTRFVAGPWHDPIQHERFVRERISRNYGDGLGYWTIIAKGDPGRFLGWVMLVPHNEVGPDVEIGWRLNRGPRGERDMEPRRLP
ncbi:GNAT family N-acetyltransferase [Sinorhizobium meliloti]|uniref:GNAT family N-acetyltransferase n=2 Tax=Rhizobium meliloti TaxID=382 RepID=UPI0006876599|nr:GNAT family N-acetyltransferase [Sinorhizobium meliloti]